MQKPIDLIQHSVVNYKYERRNKPKVSQKNKKAHKFKQSQLTASKQQMTATGTSSRSHKLVKVQATGDDSDDLPSLKTGCKKLNVCFSRRSLLLSGNRLLNHRLYRGG